VNRAEYRLSKCEHKGDYTTRVVDVDQHVITLCADCGEQVYL
jgi:hypothetical protein